MEQYFGVAVMILLAIVFAALSFMASRMLGPKRPTAAKLAPYECGIVPTKEPPQRFPVRFYIVAMIFIVFDIEIVFLYPWAVIYGQLGRFGLVEMLVFVATLVGTFAYVAASGALDWGPAKRLRRVASRSEMTTRSSSSTVRHVASPGKAA